MADLEEETIHAAIDAFLKANKPTCPIYLRPFVYTSDLGIAPHQKFAVQSAVKVHQVDDVGEGGALEGTPPTKRLGSNDGAETMHRMSPLRMSMGVGASAM